MHMYFLYKKNLALFEKVIQKGYENLKIYFAQPNLQSLYDN